MLNTLEAIYNDDEGAGISEYALLVAVILLIVAGMVAAIGINANSVFKAISNTGAEKLTGK